MVGGGKDIGPKLRVLFGCQKRWWSSIQQTERFVVWLFEVLYRVVGGLLEACLGSLGVVEELGKKEKEVKAQQDVWFWRKVVSQSAMSDLEVTLFRIALNGYPKYRVANQEYQLVQLLLLTYKQAAHVKAWLYERKQRHACYSQDSSQSIA